MVTDRVIGNCILLLLIERNLIRRGIMRKIEIYD